MPNLVDQMQFLENAELKEKACVDIKAALSELSSDQKLQVFRDLILEKIYTIIDKFPKETQKELLAIMTNKYLSEWSENE